MISSRQEREWQLLHDRITEILDQFGTKNPVGKGDYWLLDENWSWHRHQLEFQSLELLQPHVINKLQAALADYPDWDITVRIDVPGKEDEWPGMGLIIRHDEIEDELQRAFLPEKFRNVRYAGSRRLFDQD